MKLMITSAGITNPSLEKAFRKLVNGKIKIAFIPTAANIIKEDKGWLIEDLVNCKKLGEVDIVDISALKKEEWLPRLEWANVLFVGGGDTSHLMTWISKSGLADELFRLIKDRVYVGISAGSCVLSKDLDSSSEFLYSENYSGEIRGLGIIDFYIRPHLNSPYFPKVREEYLEKDSLKLDQDCYALDDDSAIVFIDGEIEVISEGKWVKYEAK